MSPGPSADGRDAGQPEVPPPAGQPSPTGDSAAQPATPETAAQPAAGETAATRPTGGQSPAGDAASAPSDAGPSAAGPSDAGPSAAGPSAAGPSPAGPSAAGPSDAGPSAAGPSDAGPSPAEGLTPAPASAAQASGRGGGTPLLSLRGAAKSFGAVHAIVDGSIDLYGGEAHGLVGENGAGKSTLVKILAGVYQPDSGELVVDGNPAVLNGPGAAQDAGIAVIYQEPTLFPDLTVAENIFMGRQPLRAGRRIDGRKMREESRALFTELGVMLDPGRICRGLSIADQQIIEIAKALSLEARIIVMDEPTAALSAAEVTRLFDVVRTLRASGAAVLFISHRLEEVFEICQRVTVMRDGRQVLSRELAGLTADDLVRAMVGRQLADRGADGHGTPGEVVLHVERLSREGVFTDISFDVRAGEIVAFAGLVGSGRSEVARAVFGIDRYDAGSVAVRGRPLRKASPTSAMAAGVGFVPEDRRQQGLVMDMSVQENMALASMGLLGTWASSPPRPNATSPRTGRSDCGSSSGGSPTRSPSCPAETSKRWCWGSGSGASPRC